MARDRQMLEVEKGLGDAAVDGLLAGSVAGVTSGLYLLIAGWITGETPAIMLGRFDPRADANALVGILVHLAVSAVYGALFVVLYRPMVRRWPAFRKATWLFGLIYGLLLMLLAETIFLSGLNSPLAEVPTEHFLLFHVVYGLTLGFILGRQSMTSD